MSRRTIAVAVFLAAALPLLMFSAPPATAATSVQGAIKNDTTWTTAGSPYILTDDVTVTLGTTLTIDPGVKVRGAAGARLLVAGTLRAVGTQVAPIVFGRNGASGTWGGIVLVGEVHTAPDTDTVVEHATIEFAEIGIYSRYDAPTIENDLFSDNETGLNVIGPRGVPLTITENVFTDNGTALTGRASGTIEVLRNDFWNNGVNIIAGSKPVYDCPDTGGGWEIHNNDILRGPQNSEFFSYDVRAADDVTVDATDNWWGTIEEERIEGRVRPQNLCCPNQVPGTIEWKPFSAAGNTTRVQPGDVPDPEPAAVVISDPAYIVSIDSPEEAECISRGEFSGVKGSAANFLAPDPPDRVKIALRRDIGGGLCAWWSHKRSRFVDGYCGVRRWFKVRGVGSWSYGFPRQLPPGRYTAYAIARGDYPSSSVDTARFRLLQGTTSV